MLPSIWGIYATQYLSTLWAKLKETVTDILSTAALHSKAKYYNNHKRNIVLWKSDH